MTFEELYRNYADSVYSFLRFRLQDAYLVEDIFQDTFLSAYREFAAERLPDSPKAWLLTIAKRRMVDRLRRSPEAELPLASELGGGQQRSFTEQVMLKSLVGQLEEPLRDVFYALYVEGMTIRETAQLFAVPEGTVKSRAFTARNKLASWMKEESPDGP